MKKRLIAVIVTVAVLLSALAAVLITRGVKKRKPPELAAIRERVESLITASREVNEILYGAGLPTYPRVYEEYHERIPFYFKKTADGFEITDDTKENKLYYYLLEDKEKGQILAYQYCFAQKEEDGSFLYFDIEKNTELTQSDRGKYRYAQVSEEERAGETPIFTAQGKLYYALPDYKEEKAEFYYLSTDEPYYDYVRFDCGYLTVADIKNKAESVYSTGYLSAVYESLFTGVTLSDRDSGILRARYIDYTDSEGNGYLLKSNVQEGFDVSRVYLFDTLKMVKPSRADFVTLEMESYAEKTPEKHETVRISLVLQEGQWMLDSPTY